MRQKEVRDLEKLIESAISEAVSTQFTDISEHTLHMMAKAATAVLEAVVDVEEGD